MARDWPIPMIRKWVEIDLKTHDWIAQRLKCAHPTIGKLCRKHGIRCQRRGPRSGTAHPDWKGGVTVSGGYFYVYAPWHPHKTRGNYVLMSRLLMERKMRRMLRREEVVHHINGDIKDNRIQNLRLFATNADHLRATLNGKCPKWTAEGKRRISEGVKKAARTHRRKELDARRQRQATSP